jgi:hypothetical protein
MPGSGQTRSPPVVPRNASVASGDPQITDSLAAEPKSVGHVPSPDSCTTAKTVLFDHYVGAQQKRLRNA